MEYALAAGLVAVALIPVLNALAGRLAVTLASVPL
jgi:Flp pilus assembly pilin Flp